MEKEEKRDFKSVPFQAQVMDLTTL